MSDRSEQIDQIANNLALFIYRLVREGAMKRVHRGRVQIIYGKQLSSAITDRYEVNYSTRDSTGVKAMPIGDLLCLSTCLSPDGAETDPEAHLIRVDKNTPDLGIKELPIKSPKHPYIFDFHPEKYFDLITRVSEPIITITGLGKDKLEGKSPYLGRIERTRYSGTAPRDSGIPRARGF